MKKILYWLPTIIWMIVIFSFSAQPSLRVSTVNWLDFILRKTAHVSEFFVLTCLLFFSLSHSTRLSRSQTVLVAFVITVAYAFTDEYHQLFVHGREGKIQDVLIDSIGIVSGTFFLKIFNHSRTQSIP
jgi:VanZ family protein